MALTTVRGLSSAQVTLSTGYLSSGDEIALTGGGSHVHLWLDDDSLVPTIKFSSNGGTWVEVTSLSAADIWDMPLTPGKTLLINAKSDSGTPKLNVLVT